MNCLRWIKHEVTEVRPRSPLPRKTIPRRVKRMAKKMKVRISWRKKVNDGRDSSLTVNASGLDESGNHRWESMLDLRDTLLYIVDASKNELNKMKELRIEMDITLQKMRAMLQRKDSFYEPSDSKDGGSSCLTEIKEVFCSSSQLLGQSHSKPCPFSERATLLACDSMKHEKCTLESSSQPPRQSQSKLCWFSQQHALTACESMKHDIFKQGSTKGIEELEAELEEELERLQLHLDGEVLLKYSRHDSEQMMVEDTGFSSCCASVEEVIDPGEVPAEVRNGVPPIELERKLHELLECRRQERIKELEAALECAENKLCKKEKEVSMWKDTAMII